MKVSFIATVYNEESTIDDLLQSLLIQSKVPDEIIIVDGGSTDSTLSEISNFQFPISKNNIKIISKKGNRAVGRNEAIKRSSSEVIVCSDAGCILDKDWVKNITKPFEDRRVDVVAGYYKGHAKTIFQKCIVPYVLVMPDKINENNFLPAARSMAFKKSVWKKTGGFPEKFSNNEDYVFAKKIKKINANIIFEKKAIVYWMPRSNIIDAFVMFYRFARGDSESRIFRPKAILVFLRYFLVFLLLAFFILTKAAFFLNLLLILTAVYVLWSIIKNIKYVKRLAALYDLPIIQMTSDIAVMLGTVSGFFK